MFQQLRLQLDRWQFARFGIIGVLNTVVGYSVIVAALAVGLGDVPANAMGYAVGLSLSYTLNRRWTFRWQGADTTGSLARFLLVFGLAYGANLIVILGFRSLGVFENPLTHLVGMCVYSVVFYLGCGRWVFPDRARRDTAARLPIWSDRLAAFWPELVALLLLAVAVVCLSSIPLSHDVVWQMWIARQMLHGVGLYTEILELNPPLWFWMAVPVQWAAEALEQPPLRLILLADFCYVAACFFLASRLLSERAPQQRAMLLLAILAAMILVPLPDFGQREHLALVGAIPYALLISRRAERRPTSAWLAGSVGLVAAVGFALKHYFIAVPLLLELWLIVGWRRDWRPFRPETWALAASALGYAIAVIQLSPAFFSTVVPMVGLAYDGYEVPFWAL
ncbi:MAG: GtrA family protein, partial [Alphaproteobacteria bacterium]|nr:GtrA family protein [Alphaproteobacteria bacterium]